jgi:alpha-N-arabinofuranosidase
LVVLWPLFFVVAPSYVAGAPEKTPLRNPGFEEGVVAEGWQVVSYGARPAVSLDPRDKREGGQSLRIEAREPSDTALGQEVTLAPGGCYRLRGWVRTEGLDPRGSSTFGTFQIQRPRGEGVLATGSNQGGDTEWTEVVVPFRVPADGKVRVCAFFVGFGKGTGTAWFDGLVIEEVDPARVPVRITREPLVAGRISPLQYGQFIEYLCDLVPAMWAERLDDGSFEGLSPYKFVYLKETDFREHPWYPSGATNRANHTADRSTKVGGEVSRKIEATGAVPSTVGISQDGVFVDADRACTFSCYLKQEGLDATVRIRLHREGTVYASAEIRPTGEWAKYRARLVPSAREVGATLTIDFQGPGTLWLDSASLMPEDAIDGWRPDVVEAVRALKPGIIRFGGSALDDANLGEFEWRDTLGDPDRRPPFRAWGGLQPAGAGLEEIVRFCRLVDAEPLICVRVTRRGPDDAADLVGYFNGAPDSRMGALRARNGHREPYRIRYWQIGNERSGADYDRQLADFAAAMKRADPNIELLSSYPTAGVLKAAGALLDYVCPHHYGCHHLAAMEADFASIRRLLAEHAPGRPIRVGVTEWNTTAGDAGPRRAMLWTLENAVACSRYHNLLHRQADLVAISNRSNLINSFCSGIIQTDNHRLYKTPTYYAQQLYATLSGDRPLAIASDLPASLGPDLDATLSADGASVILFAVNDAQVAITRPIDLSAFGGSGREVEVWTLADRDGAGEPDVTNGFGEPERVSSRRSNVRVDSPRFDYRFPPWSLTVLRWRVGDR